jgi:hypothetical protein
MRAEEEADWERESKVVHTSSMIESHVMPIIGAENTFWPRE